MIENQNETISTAVQECVDSDNDKKNMPAWKKFLIENKSFFIKEAIFCVSFFLLLHGIFYLHIVKGESMEPTLHNYSIVLANHIAPKIERGSIVVVHPEEYGDYLVKRIIGMPGDTLEIRDTVVYINGEPLEEDYIYAPTVGDYGPIYVEPGTYFVMGDNRNNSRDSRYGIIGLIERDEIISSYLFTIIP